jgi:N utilization substance protein A
VDAQVAAALLENNIDFIEDFLALPEEGVAQLKGITAEQIAALRLIIEEFVEVVEEEAEAAPYGEAPEDEAQEQEAPAAPFPDDIEAEAGEIPEEAVEEDSGDEAEEYECPECGAKITVDMTNCPNCGIGLSFEFEDA